MKDLTFNQQEQTRPQVLNIVLEHQLSMAQAAELLGVSERYAWRLLSGCTGLALFSQRVAAFPNDPDVDQSRFVSFRQGNRRIPTEAEIPSFPINGDPLEPVLGPGIFHPKIPAASVCIDSLVLDRLNEHGGKCVSFAF